jgi:hypothetical protein
MQRIRTRSHVRLMDDLRALVLADCGSRASSGTPPPSSSSKYGVVEKYFGRALPKPY